MIRASGNKPPEIRTAVFTVCLSLIAFCFLGCSIPKLESPQCTEARDSVKEFYSWYLGTDAEVRGKQRDVHDRFVAGSFKNTSGELDPFFLSDTPPTTFKIGKCDAVDDSHARVQVQLYWREERKTEQKEVYAQAIESDDKWLIESVGGQ